ncbi:GWT1-domain-containing protein [Mycena sp. CBHHK59/15]|nr:GWT1-domain-containing protein [Mycena sp. CBHHK59/15]
MAADYKTSKEAWVSGMTGSTISHINIISCVALASIALHSALQAHVYGARNIPLTISWMVLILPLLLSMTLFANNSWFLSCLLLVPTAVLSLRLPRLESRTPLPSNFGGSNPGTPRTSSPSPSSGWPPNKASITSLPALTTYRAHMLLMTILAILAVDFPVFPRSLVKCETYGVSLVRWRRMDLGVGSFVFSQGLVSAIPLLKDPGHLSAPLYPKLRMVVRKTLPIIALGVIRVLLVKGTEYPEHESEYGTHWNFFITLALLPILQVIFDPVIIQIPVSLLAIGVALLQQFALSTLGLKQYVRTAPRTNFVSANKEGIVSLAGYLSIHLLGLSTGTLMLPPSPGFFRRLKARRASPTDLSAPRQNDKTAMELTSYAAVWWALLGLASLIGVDEGVSRQMVNLMYVLWIAAFNTSFILGYLLLDMLFFPTPSMSKVEPSSVLAQASGHHQALIAPTMGAPPLLQAINTNGLPLFLVANVGTGLVNLTMRTMYASDVTSMVVLILYALGVCGVAWALRGTRVWRM